MRTESKTVKRELKHQKKIEKKRIKKEKKDRKSGIIFQEEEVPDIFESNRKTTKAMCSPDGVNPNPLDYMILNDKSKKLYVETMYIDKMPKRSLFATTYAPLFNFRRIISNVFIEPIRGAKASKMLDKRIKVIDSEVIASDKNGDRNRTRRLVNKFRKAEQWAEVVESGENTLFYVTFTFTIIAESIEELNAQCEELHNKAAQKGIELCSTYGVHPESFLSAGPFNTVYRFGKGLVKYPCVKPHVMDKYSLSTIFNHTRSNFSHPNGILAARNLHTAQPIRYTPYDESHENFNVCFSGKSGTGKSATIKMWGRRFIDLGFRFASIDYDSVTGLEGEYNAMARSCGGKVYKMDTKSNEICNIFEVDITKEYDKSTGLEFETLEISAKINDVHNMIMTMVKNGRKIDDFDLDAYIDEIIRDAVRELYDEIGLEDGNPSSLYEECKGFLNGKFVNTRRKKKLPTIHKLYVKLLNKQKYNINKYHDKAYAIAISRLGAYVRELYYSIDSIKEFTAEEYRSLKVDEKGFKITTIDGVSERVISVIGTKPYFDGQSSFVLTDDVPMLNIDLSGLPPTDKPVAQLVACNFINEYFIKKNSNNPNKLQEAIVLVDEFHRTFDCLESRKFISDLYRTARKKYVSMWSATQALADYNVSEETKAIIKNSATLVLLKQARMDAKFLKEVTPLTDAQLSELMSLGGSLDKSGQCTRKGECCLIDNDDIVCFIKVDYLKSTEAFFVETDASVINKMTQESNQKSVTSKRRTA